MDRGTERQRVLQQKEVAAGPQIECWAADQALGRAQAA